MTKENQYRAMIGCACFTLGAVANMVLTDSNVKNMKEMFSFELKCYQMDLASDTQEGLMHYETAEYYINNMQVTIDDLDAQPPKELYIYE